MRRLISVVMVLCLLLPSLASAKTKQEQSIPDFCKPILESWGAANEKELQANIVAYWKECAPEFRRYSSADQMKTSICLGWTTDNLIENSAQWDLAIVSSKDVDLQHLTDEGLIEDIPFVPEEYVVQHQRLLPEAVQSMLPADPLFVYEVYCYDYNAETNEAVFLLCQGNIGKKAEKPRFPHSFAREILQQRNAEQIRAVEGIRILNMWQQEGCKEWSLEDLLQRSTEWDIASLPFDNEQDLDALVQAEMLCDFSQDTFWQSWQADWSDASVLRSADGRIVAIPYEPWSTGDGNNLRVFVINASCADTALALDYVKQAVLSYDWGYGFKSGKKTKENDMPNELRKYGICMYKSAGDW